MSNIIFAYRFTSANFTIIKNGAASVKKDINRRHGPEKTENAEWLRNEIEMSLEKGYNPFSPNKEYRIV